MKRYSMTSLRSYSPAEDPNGDYVLYEEAQAEIEEQARLLGMSGEREAKLLAKIERMEAQAKRDQSAIEGAALHIQSMKAEIERLKAEVAATGQCASHDDAEIVRRLTAAMREADRTFETVGGSTRHYVRDCLLPILEKHGLKINGSAAMLLTVAQAADAAQPRS